MKTEKIEIIEDLSSGQYILTTLSGTRHFLDLDNKTSKRVAKDAYHRWSSEGIGLGPITPDGQEIRFSTIRSYDRSLHRYHEDHLSVGDHLRLDSFDEWRISTSIQTIERILEQ